MERAGLLPAAIVNSEAPELAPGLLSCSEKTRLLTEESITWQKK